MSDEELEPLLVWVDAQLPPALADWLKSEPAVEAHHTFSLNMLRAADRDIWEAAKRERAVITKDSDFCDMVQRYGSPPQIIWITTGNTTNTALREAVRTAWPLAATLLRQGEPLVEIGGPV